MDVHQPAPVSNHGLRNKQSLHHLLSCNNDWLQHLQHICWWIKEELIQVMNERREGGGSPGYVVLLFISLDFLLHQVSLIDSLLSCVFYILKGFSSICYTLHVAWCWGWYWIRDAYEISAIIRHFKWPFASRISQADKDWWRTLWTGMLNVNLLTNILPLAQLIHYIWRDTQMLPLIMTSRR